MPSVKALYDNDFVAWLEGQAAALRAAARSGSNRAIDWENLAEEIEALARSERRELRSRLAVIVEHLVKLEHSPARDPRDDWESTIQRERRDVERLLEDSPSLVREVPALIKKEMPHAVRAATRALERRGERGQPLRGDLSYTPEQILGDWFPPEPEA